MKGTFPTKFKYKGKYYHAGELIEVTQKEADVLKTQGFHQAADSITSESEIADSEELEMESEEMESEEMESEEMESEETDTPAPAPKRGTRRVNR